MVSKDPPIGNVTRSELEAALPEWREATEDATTNENTVDALTKVRGGATVVVYLGTWCGDSRREVTRLWKAFDQSSGKLPFSVRYVAVDTAMSAPPPAKVVAGLRFVPTLVVERDGHEIGRIVESAPQGVERDLLDLLTGTKTGVLSGRPDLAR